MRKLTILTDMDDTLENLCEAWVDWLNHRHGTDVKYQNISEWDMSKAFPMLSKQMLYEPLTNTSFWDCVTPLPGAVDTIHSFIQDGHKVVVVTAGNPHAGLIKLQKVLFKYFPFLTCHDVVVTSQKQLVRGDVLIDDAPHNLRDGEYRRILFSAPHNKKFNTDLCRKYGLIRANNWDDVYNIVCYISREKK